MKTVFKIIPFLIIFGCRNERKIPEKIINESIESVDKKKFNKCSFEILKNTENLIDILEKPRIVEFLATLSPDCGINVEFSEWSNELLFRTLEKQPDYFLQILYENNYLEKDFIISELASPIHDGFDIDSIIQKVENTTGELRLKKEILESLQIAKSVNE